MKQLTCEMCGGTDLIKQEGVFVCQSCGCKYTVEEAKKMMIEGTVDVQGTVKVDNTHMIDNYLEMAQTALDAGNNAEAETYCNKIIEISPTNYKALMIKGQAAAWQSSLQNSRVDEGVATFSKAINNAPEEEKEEIIEHAKEQIKRLSVAMISLRAERFAKWPDNDEANGFISDITSILNTVINFLTQTGEAIPISEIMAPIAIQINQSVVQAWQNVVWPDYNGDPNDSDDRANKYEWQRFIERVGYCTNLIEKAIGLCNEDDEDNIQRYENLIFMHNTAIDSCSWDYNFTDWGKSWYKDWMLTDEAKRIRRQQINQYEAKIREIKKAKAAKEAAEKAEKERIAREEAKKRFDEYWAAHAEEKKALESEQEDLKSQINSLNTNLHEQIAEINREISAIPGGTEIGNLDKEIKKLEDDKHALGLFKVKEKKAIQDQIDQLSAEKKAIQNRMASAKKELEARIAAAKADVKKKIEPLQSRVNSIDSELTAPR